MKKKFPKNPAIPCIDMFACLNILQLEKKYSSEFNSVEATVEIQSLQLTGFLMTVCHVLLVMQDWQLDTTFIR